MSDPSEGPAGLHARGGSRYVALNTSKPLLNNLDVRQAVATVLDRNAMRLTRGGAIDGWIATLFLDPSFKNQGLVQAGGLGSTRSRALASVATSRRRGAAPPGRLREWDVQRPAGDDGGGQLAAGSNTGQVVAAEMARSAST